MVGPTGRWERHAGGSWRCGGRAGAVSDLQTPALLVERSLLEDNLARMGAALPGPRLRPHVTAHTTTALARLQAAAGHHAFTCATVREVEGMAAAGLGEDLLLADEVLDARRLGAVAAAGARVTVAVDSEETGRRATRWPGRCRGCRC